MQHDPAAEQWRNAVWRAAWLRLGVRLSVGYCFLWGLAALVVRVGMDDAAAWLWWAGCGLVVVWAVAGWWSRRSVPTAEAARALLDRENRAGGLMMAGGLGGAEAWADRVGAAVVPRVRWRGGPSVGVLAVAVGFVAAAMLVPMPQPAVASRPLDVDRSLDEMTRQVETLEEEKVLETPEAEAMREAMRKVAEEAQGEDPGKTWEALDHLAERIDRVADEANELAQQRLEDAAGAEALAEALKQMDATAGELPEAGGDYPPGERLAESMRALSELMEQAAGEPTLDGMQLPEGLADAMKQAGLDGSAVSPEMLEKLAEAMEGRQEQLQELMEAMKEAGLGEGTSQYGELAEIDVEALREFLEGAGAGEGMDAEAIKVMLQEMGAGRGGVSRGPGHAEMVWKDPSTEEGVKFDPQLLPPSRSRDLDDAQRIGTSRKAPEADGEAAGSSGGALTGTAAGGGSAAEAVVLPRHRGAVERYFDRGDGSAE